MRSISSGFAVVVGAIVLAAGVLSASSASAQYHRSDVGAITVGTRSIGSDETPSFGACSTQRQRVWDGFGWRIERVEVCD